MTDAHAHLEDERLNNQINDVLLRAKNCGVNKIICVGTNSQKNKKCVEIANNFDCVWAAVGLYPEYCKEFDDNLTQEIISLCSNKKVVAIGEIGLDYHITKEDADIQKRVFVQQLDLASSLNLPIQIHCRQAMGEMIDILKQNKSKLARGGIMHCFSGSVESAKQLLDLGLKLSVGGTLTFPNSKTLQEVAKELSLDSFVLETDSPYLAPQPVRGTTNEPANVAMVAKFLASIKDVDVCQVERVTENNIKKVFGI